MRMTGVSEDPINISVLVSGGGSNLQAVLDGVADGRIPGARVGLVLSSKAGVYALERAERAGAATAVVSRDEYPGSGARTTRILELLADAGTDMVVLAGYMYVVPPEVVGAYAGRIINIHPSLIPKHCGMGYYGRRVHEAVLAAGDRESGATVHYVEDGVDTGAVIIQERVPVEPGDTPETLAARVLETEHVIIVKAAAAVAEKLRSEVEGGKMAKKRALISVSDKTGLVEFARGLAELGWEVVSTGGTYKAIDEAGVPVTSVSKVTGFPECLDGRVKTLHPAVHGGILARRDRPEHMKQLEDLGIDAIDIVAINLYPFKATIMKPGVSLPEAIENIDIGGPTMLRSAAKNHRDVAVICDPADYGQALNELRETGEIGYEAKYRLALKVFEHTASYDAMIADYLRAEKNVPLPDNPTFTYEKIQTLRYGENPQQGASYYREVRPRAGALVNARQLNGKELSFNNINDTNGALAALREFDVPTVVAVKHANPCGVGSADDIFHAYRKAYEADPVSIFGGIIAANRIVDEDTARELIEVNKVFAEIVIAPGYTDRALDVLKQKEALRVLELPDIEKPLPFGELDIKKVDGGLLIQDADLTLYDKSKLKVVTKKQPTEKEFEDMAFAMKVVKHVKSNAIVIAYDKMTLGVGPGQTNRISSVEIAVRGAGADASSRDVSGSVLASDAFFPFDDCVTAAGEVGVTAIIQPGGSIRDEDSIRRADELGMAMVFTGERHFKH